MISVIVPVYNVEPYLRKCIESIINQTYRELEILLIDDGSTDRSGEICEDFRRDSRIRVFHTENRGLSAARNLGLDNACGEYIGFVDSDDWIEADMYELLLRKAEETGADIVECGVFIEYSTVTKKQAAFQNTVSDTRAVEVLIEDGIRTQVWNKIWKRHVFVDIRFPEGRSFEDIATTYKLLQHAVVTGISEFSYHYIQRGSSISQSHDIRNLTDYTIAHRQRFIDLKDSVNEEALKKLAMFCAAGISRTWVWYLKSENDPEYINEIIEFTRKNYPVFGCKEWPINLRISVFLARYNNKVSFLLAYAMNQFYRLLKPQYYD